MHPLAPLRSAAPIALTLVGSLLSCSGGTPSAERGSGVDADPYVLRSEEELDAALEAARTRARESDRRVLLEFVADWCADCREVVRVGRLEPARSVIEERYVVVYVHVGRFDRHQALREAHDVRRIATLVVLDPSDGRRVARTTMEPISDGRGLTPERLAAWLRAPTDAGP